MRGWRKKAGTDKEIILKNGSAAQRGIDGVRRRNCGGFVLSLYFLLELRVFPIAFSLKPGWVRDAPIRSRSAFAEIKNDLMRRSV